MCPGAAEPAPNLGAVSRNVDTPPPTFVVTQKTKLRSTLTAKRTSFSFFANSKQETVKVELLRPPGATRGSGSPKLGPPNTSPRLTALATPRGKRALPRKQTNSTTQLLSESRDQGKNNPKQEEAKHKGEKPQASGPRPKTRETRQTYRTQGPARKKNRNSPAFANKFRKIFQLTESLMPNQITDLLIIKSEIDHSSQIVAEFSLAPIGPG